MANERETKASGRAENNPKSGQNRAADAVKGTVGKAKNIAEQTIHSAKKKIEDAGGKEGIKEKGKDFANKVSTGFVPDEGTTGFKRQTSRVKNLWGSGNMGKIAVVAGVILLLVIFSNLGGGDPTFDASSDASMGKSAEEIMSKLSPSEQKKFGEAIMSVYMLGSMLNYSEAAINAKLDGKTAEDLFDLVEDLKQE